jgi:hypothetical protein
MSGLDGAAFLKTRKRIVIAATINLSRARFVPFSLFEQESGRRTPQEIDFGDVGAGDGDRTRDVQLGKLAFYR